MLPRLPIYYMILACVLMCILYTSTDTFATPAQPAQPSSNTGLYLGIFVVVMLISGAVGKYKYDEKHKPAASIHDGQEKPAGGDKGDKKKKDGKDGKKEKDGDKVGKDGKKDKDGKDAEEAAKDAEEAAKKNASDAAKKDAKAAKMDAKAAKKAEKYKKRTSDLNKQATIVNIAQMGSVPVMTYATVPQVRIPKINETWHVIDTPPPDASVIPIIATQPPDPPAIPTGIPPDNIHADSTPGVSIKDIDANTPAPVVINAPTKPAQLVATIPVSNNDAQPVSATDNNQILANVSEKPNNVAQKVNEINLKIHKDQIEQLNKRLKTPRRRSISQLVATPEAAAPAVQSQQANATTTNSTSIGSIKDLGARVIANNIKKAITQASVVPKAPAKLAQFVATIPRRNNNIAEPVPTTDNTQLPDLSKTHKKDARAVLFITALQNAPNVSAQKKLAGPEVPPGSTQVELTTPTQPLIPANIDESPTPAQTNTSAQAELPGPEVPPVSAQPPAATQAELAKQAQVGIVGDRTGKIAIAEYKLNKLKEDETLARIHNDQMTQLTERRGNLRRRSTGQTTISTAPGEPDIAAPEQAQAATAPPATTEAPAIDQHNTGESENINETAVDQQNSNKRADEQ